jgi:regulator of telomere elongation helicase 1
MIRYKVDKSHLVEVNHEISINFPYKPYDVQADFMKLMTDTIIQGKNALLESPTGTGKTLCMLLSAMTSLNYLRKNFQN